MAFERRAEAMPTPLVPVSNEPTISPFAAAAAAHHIGHVVGRKRGRSEGGSHEHRAWCPHNCCGNLGYAHRKSVLKHLAGYVAGKHKDTLVNYHMQCSSTCAAFGQARPTPLSQQPPPPSLTQAHTAPAAAAAVSPAANDPHGTAAAGACAMSDLNSAALSSESEANFQRLLRLGQRHERDSPLATKAAAASSSPAATTHGAHAFHTPGSRFHGFISYRQEPEECDIPFGVAVAALFREMADHAGVRLFHDTEHLQGGAPWIEALDLVLQSVGLVFVLLWPGALERCNRDTDPMRVEIITALRRPHCLVVPVVFFTDTVTVQSGIVPSWLKPLRMRYEAREGGNNKVAALDASELLSLQMHDWLLHTQAVFITRLQIASQLRSLFQRLPSLLGTDRASDSELFDRLGVTVGMTREELVSCYVLHINACEHLNRQVDAAILKVDEKRRIHTVVQTAAKAAASSAAATSFLPHPYPSVRSVPSTRSRDPCQLSLLVWNCYGGCGVTQEAIDVRHHDGVDELFQIIKRYPSDVLALQEAPYGLVELLREDGYTVMATLVCCETYSPRTQIGAAAARKGRKARKRLKRTAAAAASTAAEESGYDVADPRHRMEIYNVIAIRADAPTDARQLQMDDPLTQPIVLSQSDNRREETDDGPVVVEESRKLQHARLRMRPWVETGGAGGSSFCTLDLWNTHLEVHDESVRFRSMQCIAAAMDHAANRAPIGSQVCPVEVSSHRAQPARDSSATVVAAHGSQQSCSSNQMLVGDLNAMSRLDYSPAERQYLSRVDRFHLGMASSHSTDPWRCMDFLEDEQKWVDAFCKAGVPRPKISVWSCRRVDHALLYRGCSWSVVQCLQIFTTASDHLPFFLVLQPPQHQT